MKNLSKILLAIFLLVGSTSVKASSIFDVVSQVPALNQGVAVSVLDSNINYLSTVDLVKWKGFNVEAGYAGSAKNTGDKIVAVFSYDLLSLKDKTTIPILNLVEFRPGVWFGVGRIGGSNEVDYGVSATVMSLKF